MPYTPPSRSFSRNSSNAHLRPSQSSNATPADDTNNETSNFNTSFDDDIYKTLLSNTLNKSLNNSVNTVNTFGNFTNKNNKLDVDAIPLRHSATTAATRQSAFHNFMNHQNDSFNALNSNTARSSKFYIMGNNSSDSFVSRHSKNNSNNATNQNSNSHSHSNSTLASESNNSNNDSDTVFSSHGHDHIHANSNSTSSHNHHHHHQHNKSNTLQNDLLKFTTESTQSYSYTPVSNNSLTMRLNVLKRSLEILLENPEWLNNSLETFPDYNTHINNIGNNNHNLDSSKLKDLIKTDKNVSYSTLQSLLQTTITSEINSQNKSLSAVSSPMDSSSENSTNSSNISTRANSIASGSSNLNISDEILKDLYEMLKLLDQKDELEISNSDVLKDKMVTLHNLALNPNLPTNDKSRKSMLRIKLLHALATPFIEQCSNQSIAGLPIFKSASSSLDLAGMSNANLKSLDSNVNFNASNNNNNNNNNNNTKFHASSNAKTKSPKAVFTVSTESPWNILNSNDLGLLVFGFSKNSLTKMKLLDLIAPRSRDLVINRLHRNTDLVFSGEIIAVKRHNKSLAWTSVWAKRKNNLIILIFEQVVCEIIDMIIERKEPLESEFKISQLTRQNRSLYNQDLLNENLSLVLPTLTSVLKNSEMGLFNNNDITSMYDSNTINKIRYFTFKREDGSFIPCAISSEDLYINEDLQYNSNVRSLIRVNLHSLPYIAGSIVITSKDYQIKSFNEAIVKNLFGTADLKNQSIDIILPDFTNLMKLALKENPNLSSQDGLVLPEHYFRKLYSWSKSNDNDERESLFLNCKGIKAKHNDGNLLTVDVQLHVPNNDLYVIRITYSRSFSNKYYDFKDDNCIDSAGSVEQNDASMDSMDSNNIPSQLKLLRNHGKHVHHLNSTDNSRHKDTDSQSSTSTCLSRSSSTNTFYQSIPVSPSTPHVISRDQSSAKLSFSPSDESNDKDDTIIELEHEHKMEKSKSESFGMSSKMTCAEHLKQEEDDLAYLKKNSPYFPKVIGAERRTKKYSDFKVLKNLGQGAYGKVVFAQYKKDPLYKDCVKSIFKERILVDTWVRDRQLGTVPSEIQILYALNKQPHANIMRIVDYFEDDHCYYLETLQHGAQGSGAVDLYDIIEVKKDMTEYEAKYIYFQIVAALNHMHQRGIVHRDIKDENIIVDKDYFVKLIDFGSAAWVKDGPFGVFVGTIDYAAPEVLNGQPYDGKSQDVWAMGILLYTLIFKENPFCSVDEILDGEVKFPKYSDVSPACLELIRKILVTDINKRPTMHEIMNDPWLYGFS